MTYTDEILTALAQNNGSIKYQDLMQMFQVDHPDRHIRNELRTLRCDKYVSGDLHSDCMIKLTSNGRRYLREGGRCETGPQLSPREPVPQAVVDDKPKSKLIDWITPLVALGDLIWNIAKYFISK